MTFNREAGVAREVGEFWAKNAEFGRSVIVGISLTEENEVDFAFNDMNLVVPIERLKRLLED